MWMVGTPGLGACWCSAWHSEPSTDAAFRTYFANLMQNCVKYFRVEARLSRMMGTFCLM